MDALYIEISSLFIIMNAEDGDMAIPKEKIYYTYADFLERGCNGASDLVVEVISPSTASHDKVRKCSSYQKAGVREYWMVEPDSKTVQACLLEDGRYVLASYNDENTAPVSVLPGCEINLREVFAEPIKEEA
jgi:Uma2 family endonuclease